MAEIFLKIFSLSDYCQVPIDSLVVLFTIKYCKTPIKITLVCSELKDEESYDIDISDFSFNTLNTFDLMNDKQFCELPNLILNSSSYVAGLCACLRQIIKISLGNDETLLGLLGFKESCLLSCAESSTWTKFCEIDLIETLKVFDKNLRSSELPSTLARFEAHMSQPVRLHNIFKYTMSKKYILDDKTLLDESNTTLEHCYAEGSFMTLADIIIFICFHTLFTFYDEKQIFQLLPLTAKWYERMKRNDMIESTLKIFPNCPCVIAEVIYSMPTISDHVSLYKSDVKRYKPKNKIFTKQEDIENSLSIMKKLQINFKFNPKIFYNSISIDWNSMPIEATPEGGELPKNRLNKKFQQLENLCKPVVQLATSGSVIVDFCAGSGHLGITVAYLLPECTVILVENKEISLNRSKDRVKKLKLTNVKFVQCNLDYFKGTFNIGMSLHACGVATDLVIEHCIRQNATFVSCPCCYGSIQNCHRLTYPRSDTFRDNVTLRDYLILSHAADQTHDEKNIKTKQGYECMSIIDTDRKLHAEQFNYDVHLMKLTPETCTPKNNLLIGIPKCKIIDKIRK